jgi:hypothetical protein
VLFIGKEDDIASAEFISQRHGVDSVAGILREYYFFFRPGVNEVFDYLAGAFYTFFSVPFKSVGDFCGEPVAASRSPASGKAQIIFIESINNLPGYERGAGVIEINRRLAVTPVF